MQFFSKGQGRTRIKRASAKLIWLAKSSAVAALLPFALATLSRSKVVIRSSIGLALGALLCLFVPMTVGKLLIVIFTWIAALLVAVAGLRTRDAEEQNRVLREEVSRYREAHSLRERALLEGVFKEKDDNLA